MVGWITRNRARCLTASVGQQKAAPTKSRAEPGDYESSRCHQVAASRHQEVLEPAHLHPAVRGKDLGAWAVAEVNHQ
jgi:hypothetical protein